MRANFVASSYACRKSVSPEALIELRVRDSVYHFEGSKLKPNQRNRQQQAEI
jgi:hypothetical protein